MARPLGAVVLAVLVGCSGAFSVVESDGGTTTEDGGASDGALPTSDGALPASDAGPAAKISIVQHTSVDFGAVTSGRLAYRSPVGQGHLLIVAAKYLQPATVRISDDAGTTWQVANPATSNGIQTVSTFYGVAPRSGPSTVTFEFSTSSNARAIVLEYDGVSRLDQHAEGAAARSSGPASSGPVRTTREGTLFFAFSDQSACGQAAPSGFVRREAPGPIPGCNSRPTSSPPRRRP
jgi:hypothetical protein